MSRRFSRPRRSAACSRAGDGSAGKSSGPRRLSRFMRAKYRGGSGWPARMKSTNVCSFTCRLKRAVRAQFVADSRHRNIAQRLATRAARAVCRPDLEELRQAAEFTLDRRELRPRRRLHDTDDSGRSFQQVGPTDVADEDEIAAGQRDEVLCTAAGVTNEIAQVLRCMAGRVNRLEFDEPHRELIVMAEQPVGILAVEQPLVLPVRATLLRRIDEHAARSHLPQARRRSQHGYAYRRQRRCAACAGPRGRSSGQHPAPDR